MALFNSKKEKNGYVPASEPIKITEAQQLEPPEELMEKPRGNAISTVGTTVRVKGELEGDEALSVEGHVEGIVNVKMDLVVGEKGLVEAEVHASTVVVHGRLIGNVIADRKVEISPTGTLEGNIHSPKVAIAEGAQFRGNVDMSPVGEDKHSGGPAESRHEGTGKKG